MNAKRWFASKRKLALLTLTACVAFALGATAFRRSLALGRDQRKAAAAMAAGHAALIVLDGARNCSFGKGAYDSYHVSYTYDESYPASDAIDKISSRLKSQGWKPLEEDWLNPGTPSSYVEGWSEFTDSTRSPDLRVHRWGAQWQDAQGNIVDYTFGYSYPENSKPDLSSMSVDGAWSPAESVKKYYRTPLRGPMLELLDTAETWVAILLSLVGLGIVWTWPRVEGKWLFLGSLALSLAAVGGYALVFWIVPFSLDFERVWTPVSVVFTLISFGGQALLVAGLLRLKQHFYHVSELHHLLHAQGMGWPADERNQKD